MDPRIEKIERAQVYGLFHDGLLIYVGSTRQPLRKRLHQHRGKAGGDSPVYQYLDSHVEDLHGDLEIRVLTDYETEQEALDDLKDSTLNVEGAVGREEIGHDWTPEEVDRLEELIDQQSVDKTADELGISRHQVHNAAVKLGLVEIDDPTVDWEKWKHKLGTMLDRELAELIGCSTRSVSEKRNELGIRPYGRIDWDKWDQFLGEMPDGELADRIGCSLPGVERRRSELGIQAYSPRRRLTDEQILEIRVRYAEHPDETHQSLADEFDVNPATIGHAVRGDTHQDLPMPEELTEEEKEKILRRSRNRQARAGRAQDNSRTPSTHSQKKATS